MFTFLGIVFLIATIVMFVMKKFSREGVKSERQNSYHTRWDQTPVTPWLLNIKKWMFVTAIACSLALVTLPNCMFRAERGYQYVLINPIGGKSAVMEPGVKVHFFCKIDKWQKFIDVVAPTPKQTQQEVDFSEVEGIMDKVDLRFIDQVTADGYISARFELPRDKDSFIKLAIKYRTMTNLVNNTIIPTIKEQLINTAYMFAAQDYISGDAQSFRQVFEDQLKGGTYSVKKIKHLDTIYSGEKSRAIKKINTRYEVQKVTKNGIPVRFKHEIIANNIIVSQAIIGEVALDPDFKDRLKAQRDESALRQLEVQKTKTAKDKQARIIAEGETAKASERVTQETEQIAVVIAIETKLKQETTNKKLAKIQLETERIKATQKRVRADAESYEITKKVRAGITPEKRLQMELDAGVKRAHEWSRLTLPSTYITTDGKGKGDGLLSTILGAQMAKEAFGKKK